LKQNMTSFLDDQNKENI